MVLGCNFPRPFSLLQSNSGFLLDCTCIDISGGDDNNQIFLGSTHFLPASWQDLFDCKRKAIGAVRLFSTALD
jgi:hypothetical protein